MLLRRLRILLLALAAATALALALWGFGPKWRGLARGYELCLGGTLLVATLYLVLSEAARSGESPRGLRVRSRAHVVKVLALGCLCFLAGFVLSEFHRMLLYGRTPFAWLRNVENPIRNVLFLATLPALVIGVHLLRSGFSPNTLWVRARPRRGMDSVIFWSLALFLAALSAAAVLWRFPLFVPSLTLFAYATLLARAGMYGHRSTAA